MMCVGGMAAILFTVRKPCWPTLPLPFLQTPIQVSRLQGPDPGLDLGQVEIGPRNRGHLCELAEAVCTHSRGLGHDKHVFKIGLQRLYEDAGLLHKLIDGIVNPQALPEPGQGLKERPLRILFEKRWVDGGVDRVRACEPGRSRQGTGQRAQTALRAVLSHFLQVGGSAEEW